MSQIKIVKQDGVREIFDSHKLRSSLIRARATKSVIEDIVDYIEKEIKDGMTTDEIYRRAFKKLEEVEKKSAIKYSVRRSIFDLGPSGFPFEKFVAELFEAKGYTASTGLTLAGKCVEHEVDVLAYNDSELFLCEVKFHNDPNIKTDTKDALYIKARFDDLANTTIPVDGKDRKMTNGLLITNTKFTGTAKKYVECVGTFNLISWEYPKKGNLYDLIEETGIHPLTCIPDLSKHDKRELLDRGIVNCSDLKQNISVMKEIGIESDRIEDIIKSVNVICG